MNVDSSTYTRPQINWQVSQSASSLHIARTVRDGFALTDEALASAMKQPAADLENAIIALQADGEYYWRHLIGLAADYAGNQQLAEIAWKKTSRREVQPQLLRNVAAAIGSAEAALQSIRPQHDDEMSHRMRPLREQWEARGPGLLLAAARLTHPLIVAPTIRFITVYPACGGAGEAHHQYNAATVEAVLTNPHHELPETLRLAWLATQLNLDLPMFGELIRPERLPAVAGAAMAAVVLRAASELEMTTLTPQTLSHAIQAWRISAPEMQTADLTAAIMQWWETYDEGRPAWHVALKALDRMLGGERSS